MDQGRMYMYDNKTTENIAISRWVSGQTLSTVPSPCYPCLPIEIKRAIVYILRVRQSAN